MNRILITGGPRTGKTTLGAKLSKELNIPLRSTDEVIDLGWSEGSEEVANWLQEKGSWIIEGVSIPRAIRKLPAEFHPTFSIIYLSEPKESLSPGQARMALGIDTVWEEILPQLKEWGIPISYQ